MTAVFRFSPEELDPALPAPTRALTATAAISTLVPALWVSGLGFGVWGLGSRVQGLGFRVQGWVRVEGL